MTAHELPFLCHGEKDYAKILWKDGEAVGFYSVKTAGNSRECLVLNSLTVYLHRKTFPTLLPILLITRLFFFHIICTVYGYVLSSSFRYLMEYLFNQTLSDTCDGLHLCQKEPARSGLGAQDAARLLTQFQREFSGTEIPPTTFHV